MRDLLWQPDAWAEYEDIQSDKASLKKINRLIDKKNRLIFRVDDVPVHIPCRIRITGITDTQIT